MVSHITSPFGIADNVFGIGDGDNMTAPIATLTVPANTQAKYSFAAGWKEFPTITEMEPQGATPGDLTGEGEVDDSDIAAIIQLIMTGQYDEKADLNKDNKVDAADLVLLINMVE